jgi:hypothetical protein
VTGEEQQRREIFEKGISVKGGVCLHTGSGEVLQGGGEKGGSFKENYQFNLGTNEAEGSLGRAGRRHGCENSNCGGGGGM